MTNPVILLGTQSNGETLPVQVDATGRLVAEGLQGSEGPEGPAGQPGADGGSFPLPPDPFEGALLGWLNGGLAWVNGSVPIPEGVFGPIISVDSNGLLGIEGPIPSEVGAGVYVYQCTKEGTYFASGLNVSRVWSDNEVTTVDQTAGNKNNVFNGYVDTAGISASTSITFDFTPSIPVNAQVRIYYYGSSSPVGNVVFNKGLSDENTDNYNTSGAQDGQVIASTGILTTKQLKNFTLNATNGSSQGVSGIEIDGTLLVDEPGLGLRVNQVSGQNILGNPTNPAAFTVGAYLRVPPQRVAPWVLYGNDPTSLIDHLRST